jgi:nucleoside-diphosphate kinase
MMEKTLVIVKPDGVQRALIGEVVSRIERTGLKIIAMKMVYASEEQAGEHYEDDEAWLRSVGEKTLKSAKEKGFEVNRTSLEQGQWVRQMLIKYISMSPSVALVIEGHGAIGKVRTITGGTSPHDCRPGTIRGDYSIDSYALADKSERPVQNLIHASDSVGAANREIKIWFKEEELHVFKRVDEDLIYRKGN